MPRDGETGGAHQHVVLRHHEVFQHRHTLKQADVLEGARDAGARELMSWSSSSRSER